MSGLPLTEAPNNSAWQVSVRQEEVTGEVPSRSLQIDLAGEAAQEKNAYSNGIQRSEIVTFSGSRWIQYVVRGHIIMHRPESTTIVALSPEQLKEEGLSYEAGKLREVEWITNAHYQGTTTYQGVVCDVFRKEGSAPVKEIAISQSADLRLDEPKLTNQEDPDSDRHGFRIALINRESRLPLAVGDGQTIRNYRWQTLAEPLVLSDQLRQALEQANNYPEMRKRRYNIPQ